MWISYDKDAQQETFAMLHYQDEPTPKSVKELIGRNTWWCVGVSF